MHLKFVVSQSKIMTLTFKNSYNPVKPIFLGTPQALSIQQKFRFEMSEIPRSQWSGIFRLHSPYPSHRAFGYCSCKQDTKERYWEEQFCQMERDISVRPTEMTRPVKVDLLQSWFRIFRSNQTEMARSL